MSSDADADADAAANADWMTIENLAKRVILDGDGAWEQFWSHVRPRLEAWIANPRFLPQLAERADRRRDVVIIAWEKLQERDSARLRSFFEPEPKTGSFRAWLYRVFKNLGIDYVRTLPESIRQRKPAADPDAPLQHWWDVVTLDFELTVPRDPVTMRDMVRRMLEFLDDSVPERQRRAIQLREQGMTDAAIAAAMQLEPANVKTVIDRGNDRLQYRAVVQLWIQEYTATEIAERLDLDDTGHATRILGSAKQLLRRHFRAKD